MAWPFKLDTGCCLTVNLSRHPISRSDSTLLDKGLTFIPTTRFLPIRSILDSRDRLVRSLKLRSFFGSTPTSQRQVRLFRHKSNWTPDDKDLNRSTLETVALINYEADEFLSSFRLPGRDDVIGFANNAPNLSQDECGSLRRLKQNRDVIIKPADKGGATVIMDRDAYVEEAHRQLYDPKYYRKLDHPIYLDETLPRLNVIIDRMYEEGFIDQHQHLYLRADENECRQRRFYLLPKIHKDRATWPSPRMPAGRPIVSDCRSESYNISEYIEHYITPLGKKHPSYLKDTYHFIEKVRGKIVPKDCLLVSGDVTSLYTNMDHGRTIAAVREAFRKYPQGGRPDRHLLDLLELTLRSNDFEFNDECFLQVFGCPMGKRFIPGLANLYLVDWDRQAMNGGSAKPELFGRFLDDVFFVWTATREELREFENFLNSLIPDIAIKFVVSCDSCDFLDTTVYKADDALGNTVLQTKVFFKETDTHQLLHRDSYHPRHTCEGVLTSQLLRFKRISSTRSDYDEACSVLFKALRSRGYSSSRLRKRKREMWQHDYIPRARDVRDDDVIPIVIPYTRQTTQLAGSWKRIISDNFRPDEDFEDEEEEPSFRMITAFQRGRNLRDQLIRSKVV